MLEIKFLEDESNVLLYVDGIVIEKKDFRVSGTSSDFCVEIFDEHLAEKISLMTLSEIPKELEILELCYKLDFVGTISRIFIFREPIKGPDFVITLTHECKLEEWKNSFSIKELDKTLREVMHDHKEYGLEYSGLDPENNFSIEIEDINSIHTIKETIDNKRPLIDEIYNKVSNLLIEKSRGNAVVSIFDFPEQVRVPCEQYLIYFADFLRNLGIKATTDITHEAGKVLFSITPESKDIALQQIREALDMYLNLPGSMQDIQLISMDIGIKEQQLLAQVQHLRSQILLANALTQSQRDTIQSQQTIIDQQQQVLDASILQQSLLTETLKNKTEDSEKILGGAISLTRYEGKGFHINIANIYRLLKEKFNKYE